MIIQHMRNTTSATSHNSIYSPLFSRASVDEAVSLKIARLVILYSSSL